MKLTVYTAPWCRDCREAKRFLAQHNIPYAEIDIEQVPGAADTVFENVGKKAIPQFVLDHYCPRQDFGSQSGIGARLRRSDRLGLSRT
jgi:glutaredoxin